MPSCALMMARQPPLMIDARARAWIYVFAVDAAALIFRVYIFSGDMIAADISAASPSYFHARFLRVAPALLPMSIISFRPLHFLLF